MLTQAPERVEVLVNESHHLDEALDDAEAVLRKVAMEHRCTGILATRHSPVRYTLELSHTVPFGETWEQTLP